MILFKAGFTVFLAYWIKLGDKSIPITSAPLEAIYSVVIPIPPPRSKNKYSFLYPEIYDPLGLFVSGILYYFIPFEIFQKFIIKLADRVSIHQIISESSPLILLIWMRRSQFASTCILYLYES